MKLTENRQVPPTAFSEMPSIPSLKRVSPHPEFAGLSWSLVWHQRKSSPMPGVVHKAK